LICRHHLIGSFHLVRQWGLTLDKEPTKVTARLLDEEMIIFGGNKTFKFGPNADFGH
jgi:hypothetical protein